MGIYIFNTDILYQRLTEDSLQSDSIHDFGYSLLPNLVNRDRVFAYEFDNYWQDIGTVEAYYKANMELLNSSSRLVLDNAIVIENSPAALSASAGGRIVNSIISPGCVVKGYVENSVLSPGVVVEEQAEVINSVVMDNTQIGFHSIVDSCMLDEEVTVGKYCHLGFGLSPASGIAEITTLGKGVVVPSQTAIGRQCKIHPGLGREAFGSRFVASGTVVSTRE